MPKSYDDCIQWALSKYVKYFQHDIKQLLFTYPSDHQTKDGKPFWTLPKRPPTPLTFDMNDELSVQFVSTLAYLRANMFGLQTQKNWRSKEMREEIALKASGLPTKPWVPSEDKKQEINTEVANQEGSKA